MRGGLATLLIDLLTSDEEETTADRNLRFDIPLLAERLSRRSTGSPDEHGRSLPVGCFGASTGAAAALVAAAERPQRWRPSCRAAAARISPAMRCRASRSDAAHRRRPTTRMSLQLNQQAQTLLAGESRLEIVPGATHLFEEPGALEEVAALARDWFVRHLRKVDV